MITLVALANSVAAIPLYAAHGAETPVHMVGNAVMKGALTKIFNGNQRNDMVRSKVINGPYSMGLTFAELTENAVSTALRLSGTTTIPLAGLGIVIHGVVFPVHVLMKGAASFLIGGALMPVESRFGYKLSREEEHFKTRYEENSTIADELVRLDKEWATNKYDPKINAKRKDIIEQIRAFDRDKASSIAGLCLDIAPLRAAYDAKRNALVAALGSKERLAELFNHSKYAARDAAYAR
jgi:hypothetical protein